MVDFHSHVLPYMDDGADSIETSLRMLRESAEQGVDILFATSHFYADEDDPDSFLQRRAESFDRLCEAMDRVGGPFPEIALGAEVLYFPGMSVSDELCEMTMGDTPCLLIEPPLSRWTDTMLDEIEEAGSNLKCIPVIAHIDRYMRVLNDNRLFDRLEGRRVLVQANASFFTRPESSEEALEYMRRGKIHFIGSDCHNLTNRPPNLGELADVVRENGELEAFSRLNGRVYSFLGR